MAEPIAVARRREVFDALVDAQDSGLEVAASRRKVAALFGLTAKTLGRIEKPGPDAQWPPLDT